MTHQRLPDDRDPAAYAPIVPKPVEPQNSRDFTRGAGSPWPFLTLALTALFIVMLGFVYTRGNAPTPTTTTTTTSIERAPTGN